jgi:hypothetical protein
MQPEIHTKNASQKSTPEMQAGNHTPEFPPLRPEFLAPKARISGP